MQSLSYTLSCAINKGGTKVSAASDLVSKLSTPFHFGHMKPISLSVASYSSQDLVLSI